MYDHNHQGRSRDSRGEGGPKVEAWAKPAGRDFRSIGDTPSRALRAAPGSEHQDGLAVAPGDEAPGNAPTGVW